MSDIDSNINIDIQNTIEELDDTLNKIESLNWFKAKFRPPKELINRWYFLDGKISQYLDKGKITEEQKELIKKYFNYVHNKNLYYKFPR